MVLLSWTIHDQLHLFPFYSRMMVSPRLTLLLVLVTASILSLPAEARRKAPGGRCGLSCYRSAQKQFGKLQSKFFMTNDKLLARI